MVLTTSELIASFQNEVRILRHLAGKVEPTMIDYRQTPKQRSTIELLQYMTMMGPTMLGAVRTGTDEELRGDIEILNRKGTRGFFLVNNVLCVCAAYRTQLFLYLKACGSEELNTYNLRAGMDAPAAV